MNHPRRDPKKRPGRNPHRGRGPRLRTDNDGIRGFSSWVPSPPPPPPERTPGGAAEADADLTEQDRQDDARRAAADFFRDIAQALDDPAPPLATFFREAWKVLNPEIPLKWAPYLDALAEHLEAVALGQIRNLTVNMPPRNAKSTTVEVMFPAWVWSERPWRRFLFTSYTQSLSTKHSVDRRNLIESPWFQLQWGDRFKMATDHNIKTEFANTERGHMVATSVGGTTAGKGGDILVADDIMNPAKIRSAEYRESAWKYWTDVFLQRQDDPARGAVIVVEHRLHKGDLTGRLMAEGGKDWVHLSLPAIAEKRQVIKLPISGKTIVRERGEPLNPDRESAKDFQAKKQRIGIRTFNAQYQQNPGAEAGAMVKRSYWRYFREPPTEAAIQRSIWTFDTAQGEDQKNDPTAGFQIVQTAQGYFILRRVHDRLAYPALKRTIRSTWKSYPTNAIIIEKKSSGGDVIADLTNPDPISEAGEPPLPIIAFNPTADKETRVDLVTPAFEAGIVFIPEGEKWAEELIEEFANFPDGDNDDQVDAVSQGLLYLRRDSSAPSAVGATVKTPGAWGGRRRRGLR